MIGRQRYHEINGKTRHLSGWRRDIGDFNRDASLATISSLSMLAPSTDLRALNPHVENQGEIGSCTCNAASTAAEIILRREGIDVQLSRLWLYAKVRDYEGVPLAEDSGAQIRDVVKLLANLGCPSENSYPYDTANLAVEPPLLLDNEASKHKISFYYRCTTLTTLKASLVEGFPVVFGFAVPKNMMEHECTVTGEVRKPLASESYVGGHAVLAMGYDDTKVIDSEIGAVLCLNSWGHGWGIGGYFLLPYWFFTSGQASDMWTIRRVTL